MSRRPASRAAAAAVRHQSLLVAEDATVYASAAMQSRPQPATRRPRPGDGSASHVRSDPVYVRKAQLFRALGHPVRIRVLELLLDGERTVGELQAALRLDSSGTSQHLAALRQQGVLESRRAGTSVYYRIRDPRVSALMVVAREILTSALSDSHTLLAGLGEEPPAPIRP